MHVGNDPQGYLEHMEKQDKFSKQVNHDVERIRKAEQERPNLMSQTIYVGTLGIMLVAPVIAGAYLGRWLDGMLEGYSMRWTLSMIFLGLVVGIVNVYFLIKEP